MRSIAVAFLGDPFGGADLELSVAVDALQPCHEIGEYWLGLGRNRGQLPDDALALVISIVLPWRNIRSTAGKL